MAIWWVRSLVCSARGRSNRDVHPGPITYDELLDRTIRYGTAIRTADPQALIAGPAEWGWTGYLYSAQDSFVGTRQRPDRRAHGDVPLMPWYLKKLHDHEKATGTRVLDVFDVHFYPQGDGVYSEKADTSTAALRLRSTRALWDPTYKDESWIAEPIKLLPRLKEWVQQNYPGLKISLGEYSFGGEQHMSGGLAEAEALGRTSDFDGDLLTISFGRNGHFRGKVNKGISLPNHQSIRIVSDNPALCLQRLTEFVMKFVFDWHSKIIPHAARSI